MKETSTLTPEILRPYLNPVFVETGTYKGGGVACALEVGFKSIYSIEIDEELVKRAQSRYMFTNQGVQIIKGDAGKILGKVINNILQPITFFLDSHKQLPDQPESTSLLDELTHIKDHVLVHRHVILIDDIRFFRENRWHIPLDNLLDIVRRIKPNPQISYINNKFFENDIMVIV